MPLALLATVAVVAGTFGATQGIRAVADPWAVSLTGGPTLTGYWAGEVYLTPGAGQRIVLHLYYPPSGSCGNCPEIEGEARICGGAGPDRVLRVWGNPGNHRGTRFTLEAHRERNDPGTHLSEIAGEWHGDLITARPTVTLVDPDEVVRSANQPADPPPFELRRADEAGFAATC